MSTATKAGFTGGLVVDYPNSKKAKKFYLCLMSGAPANASLPQALGVEGSEGVNGRDGSTVSYDSSRKDKKVGGRSRGGKKHKDAGGVDKDWILRKKSLYRQRGKESVPADSKFTGRKRRPKF